jgi:hypothetical protein
VSRAWLGAAARGGNMRVRVVLHVVALGGLLVTAAVSPLAHGYFTRGVTTDPGWSPIPHTDVNPLAVNTFLNEEPDPAVVARSLDMIAAGGFGAIRQIFGWYEIEPRPGVYVHEDGRSSWEKYDRIVDMANARGLQVIARLEKPPAWARAGQPNPEIDGPPDRLSDYANFVEQVVGRYRDKLTYVQIWNEPNLSGEWGAKPIDPRGYVELLAAGYQAAKAANPEVVVLLAGLAPTDQTGPENLSDLLFLQRVYDYGGAAFFDIAAVMVYGYGYSPYDRRVAFERNNFSRPIQTREIMERNGDGGTPVWAVEYGWVALPDDWAGEPSPWGEPVSAETQADYLVEGYLRAQREWPWMGLMAVWTFRFPHPPDAPDQVANPTRGFALVEHDFTPRPAYLALQRAAPRIDRAGTGAYELMPAERDRLAAGDTIHLDVLGDAVDLVVSGSGSLVVSVDEAAARQITVDARGGEPERIEIAGDLGDGAHRISISAEDGAGAERLTVHGFVVSNRWVHSWIYPWIDAALVLTLLLNAASLAWCIRDARPKSPVQPEVGRGANDNRDAGHHAYAIVEESTVSEGEGNGHGVRQLSIS